MFDFISIYHHENFHARIRTVRAHLQDGALFRYLLLLLCPHQGSFVFAFCLPSLMPFLKPLLLPFFIRCRKCYNAACIPTLVLHSTFVLPQIPSRSATFSCTCPSSLERSCVYIHCVRTFSRVFRSLPVDHFGGRRHRISSIQST